MHKCKENMNAMLVLKVSKHKTYNFQKFLIFLIFQKFEKIWDVTYSMTIDRIVGAQ